MPAGTIRGGEKALQATEGTKQFARTLERPPEGIMLLTSCAAGQISREDAALGHGIFMHYVLEVLRGRVAAQHNGRVSLLGLADYASHETKIYVSNKFNVLQTPALKGDFSDFEFVSPSVNVITNTLGAWRLRLGLRELREFDASGGVKETESVGPVRHARECVGVVCGLVQRHALRRISCRRRGRPIFWNVSCSSGGLLEQLAGLQSLGDSQQARPGHPYQLHGIPCFQDSVIICHLAVLRFAVWSYTVLQPPRSGAPRSMDLQIRAVSTPPRVPAYDSRSRVVSGKALVRKVLSSVQCFDCGQ